MTICDQLTVGDQCVNCGDESRTIDPPNMAFVIWLDYRDFNNYNLGIDNGQSPPDYHYATNGVLNRQYCELKTLVNGVGSTYSPSWPLYVPSAIPDTQLIHIGLFGAVALDIFDSIPFLCCLMQDAGVPVDDLHIITPYDLNTYISDGLTELPDGFVDAIQACVSLDGGPEFTDIYKCCAQVEQLVIDVEILQEDLVDQGISIGNLETCCTDNSNAIAALQSDVADNVNDIATLTSSVNALIEQMLEVMRTLAAHQECINEVCGENESTCAHYQIGGSYQVPPNVPTWLNLTSQIEDASPPIVLAGPLWSAELAGDCAWVIDASIRYAVSDWCIGEKAELWLVACGVRYLLDSEIVSTASGAINLSGSFVLNTPPDCTDVHLETYHDSINSPFKIIEYGDFKACCG